MSKIDEYDFNAIQIANALLEIGSVADACVVRPEGGGSHYSVYVSLCREDDLERLHYEAQCAIGDSFIDLTLYRVTNIPYTEDGNVDHSSLVKATQTYLEPEKRSVSSHQVPSPIASMANTDCSADGRPSLLSGGPLLDTSPQKLSLASILERAANRGGGGIRFVSATGADTYISYYDLYQAALGLGGCLAGFGVRSGNKIMLAIDSRKKFITSFWACIMVGAIPVPCPVPADPMSNEWQKIEATWQTLGRPIVLVTLEEEEPAMSVPELIRASGSLVAVETLVGGKLTGPEPRHSDDIALLLLTSGSSGAPKCVIQTHRALLSHCSGASAYNRFTTYDVSLNWLPLDHVGGLVMSHLRDVWLGCEQIQVDTEVVLARPVRWLELVDRYRASITWAPNFAFALINACEREVKNTELDLSCLRFILNGAEMIDAAQTRTFLNMLEPKKLSSDAMKPVWGMSETSSGVVYSHQFNGAADADNVMSVAVGKPMPGFELRIVGPEGEIVSEGIKGDLEVRGEPVTPGYFANIEASNEAFSADGWLRTGDTATVRNGELFISGRSKDIIIINGRNYSCSEIEGVLRDVPGIRPDLVVAVAVRDKKASSEKVGIVFVPSLNYEGEKSDICDAIKNTLIMKFRCASPLIVAVNEADIPRTSIGKILRSQLQKLWTVQESYIEHVKVAQTRSVIQVWRQKRAERTSSRQLGQILIISCCEAQLAVANALLTNVFAGTSRLLLGRYVSREYRSAEYFDPVLRDFFAKEKNAVESSKEVLFLVDDHVDVMKDGRLNSPAIVLRELLGTLRDLLDKLLAYTGTQQIKLRVVFSLQYSSHSSRQWEGIWAGVDAWLKSVHVEFPKIDARLLVLPSSLDDEASKKSLLLELETADKDANVVYRSFGRTVPRLRRCTKSAGLPSIEPGGLYMIVGGLGGVGRCLAQHLLRKYRANLLLVGRGSDEAGRVEAVNIAISKGAPQRVMYVSADVGEIERLRYARDAAEAHFGTELRGIFHLAATLDNRSLLFQTDDELGAVLHSKVKGTDAVLELLGDRPSGLAVFFASVNGVFGGAGLPAYAAANGYQIGAGKAPGIFSDHRVYGMAWSAWKDTGLQIGRADEELAMVRGYLQLQPDEAFKIFDEMMLSEPGSYVVGIDPDATMLAWQFCDEPHILGSVSKKPSVPDTEDLGTYRNGSEISVEFSEVAERLRMIWASALNVEAIGDHDNFFNLGGHSLLVPTVRENIREHFGIHLRLIDIYRYGTISALAQRISELL